MTRKILIVKPYSKLAAAHKLFATFMKFLIMGEIEVIDKSASTYCFTNPDFLLICRIYFRLEALQQFPHPFLSVFYTYEALCNLQENTWSIETISFLYYHYSCIKLLTEPFKPFITQSDKSIFMGYHYSFFNTYNLQVKI